MPGSHLASVDGAIGPASAATIEITDDGLLRGDGAFEVVKLYAGRPFSLAQHLDRLERSSAAIELSFDRRLLEQEIDALLSEHGAHDAQLRIVLTRGGHRIAICEPLPAWPASISLASVTFSPSEILTGVKSISYAANMQATRLAARAGAEEALLVRPDGIVLEAPTSSIFWVTSEGELQTPSLDVGILQSITRELIVDALEVTEGAWRLDEVARAREAFLASTTREVQAIARVDGHALAEVPGSLTNEAAAAVRRAVEAELG